MILKLKRIAPLQAGKMLAAFYGILSLIIVPLMLVGMGAASLAAKNGGAAAPVPLMFGMGIGFLIVVPIIYTVMGFVGGVICAFVYNLLAGWIGGFELEFTQSPVNA